MMLNSISEKKELSLSRDNSFLISKFCLKIEHMFAIMMMQIRFSFYGNEVT